MSQKMKNSDQIKRNPGMPLELEWIESVQVNTSAVERRTSSLLKRRTVALKHYSAWIASIAVAITLQFWETTKHGNLPISQINILFEDFQILKLS